MLQQVIELVNSDTVVEISDSGVKVYDNVEGYRPLRQVIELEDAVTLAKAILFFAENGCDEATAAAIERGWKRHKTPVTMQSAPTGDMTRGDGGGTANLPHLLRRIATMPPTYADFEVSETEEMPLDTPPPAEDESFEEWQERVKADREVWEDEIWQQRNGWMR